MMEQQHTFVVSLVVAAAAYEFVVRPMCRKVVAWLHWNTVRRWNDARYERWLNTPTKRKSR